jgi:uncharacterized protein YfdQ (DUF2303 family)
MFQELINALRLPNNKGGITLPPGAKILPDDLYSSCPDDSKGQINAESIEGLLDYIKLYLNDTTVVCASLNLMNIAAIFDWHDPGSALNGWGEHVATFPLQYTRAWQDWIRISGKPMSQQTFAEFVEEHLEDITEPTAAEVLTVATSLSGMRKVSFTNAVRLQNGDTSLCWEETTDAKAAGDVRVPSGIKLRIPVFKGAEESTTFEVSGLFRYRINEGKLSFEVKLLHCDNIAELAFDEVVKNLRAKLATINKSIPPVIHGAIHTLPRTIIEKNIRTA